MRQESKILFLFVYLLLALSYFGVASQDIEVNTSIIAKSDIVDLSSISQSTQLIKNDNQRPLSSFPFSDLSKVELEPDEEDLCKKDFKNYNAINRDRLRYHAKAPPVKCEAYPITQAVHTPIFVLLEVFRL